MARPKKPASAVDPKTETVDTTDSPADAADDSAHELPDPQGSAPVVEMLSCQKYPNLIAFTPHGKVRFEDGTWEPQDENDQLIARHVLVAVEEVVDVPKDQD